VRSRPAGKASGPSTGRRNLMTPAGLRALQDEHDRLWREERPRIVENVAWAASLGDRSENAEYIEGKKKLRQIDRRLNWLSKQIETAEVIDPRTQVHRDRVLFGATVTYANGRDEEITVTLVGHTEADFANGRISWNAPVARALRGARVGDERTVETPAGTDILEVLEISYPD